MFMFSNEDRSEEETERKDESKKPEKTCIIPLKINCSFRRKLRNNGQ
jgi:hypothetical protein